jgi:hypothetical protein
VARHGLDDPDLGWSAGIPARIMQHLDRKRDEDAGKDARGPKDLFLTVHGVSLRFFDVDAVKVSHCE